MASLEFSSYKYDLGLQSLLTDRDEKELENIMSLISKDLSEPYSIYTYRYFIHSWPQLCFLVRVSLV